MELGPPLFLLAFLAIISFQPFILAQDGVVKSGASIPNAPPPLTDPGTSNGPGREADLAGDKIQVFGGTGNGKVKVLNRIFKSCVIGDYYDCNNDQMLGDDRIITKLLSTIETKSAKPEALGKAVEAIRVQAKTNTKLNKHGDFYIPCEEGANYAIIFNYKTGENILLRFLDINDDLIEELAIEPISISCKREISIITPTWAKKIVILLK